jgi:hypothetical protein
MPSLFLAVIADDLDPECVSEAFGLQPSESWRKGERKSFVKKNGEIHWFRSTNKWGGWKHFFKSPRRGRELTDRELIRKMMAVGTSLNRRKARLRALINGGHEIYLISLVQHTSSLIIPPELHRRLGELGIHLQIDFWPSAKK